MKLNESLRLAVGAETIELDALDVVTIDDNSRKQITAELLHRQRLVPLGRCLLQDRLYRQLGAKTPRRIIAFQVQ
jgi:hypothetical protein